MTQEQAAQLAAIVEDLADYVSDLGRRLSGTDRCPFCAAWQGAGWQYESHTGTCITSQAEALRKALAATGEG